MKPSRILSAAVLGLALSAHAGAPAAPQTTSGEIILEQRTTITLGPNGQPAGTRREMRARMRAENGVVWSTLLGSKWQVSKGNDYRIVNPRSTSTVGQVMRDGPPPVPELYGDTLLPLDSGLLGKKVEDGVTIAGEWATYQFGPTASRPAWVERSETWFRVDTSPKGKRVPRLHRRSTSSPYELSTVDYFYMQTERLHASLFEMPSDRDEAQ